MDSGVFLAALRILGRAALAVAMAAGFVVFLTFGSLVLEGLVR